MYPHVRQIDNPEPRARRVAPRLNARRRRLVALPAAGAARAFAWANALRLMP